MQTRSRLARTDLSPPTRNPISVGLGRPQISRPLLEAAGPGAGPAQRAGQGEGWALRQARPWCRCRAAASPSHLHKLQTHPSHSGRCKAGRGPCRPGPALTSAAVRPGAVTDPAELWPLVSSLSVFLGFQETPSLFVEPRVHMAVWLVSAEVTDSLCGRISDCPVARHLAVGQ